MLNLLLKSRVVMLIIATFLFLNSLAFTVIGIWHAWHGYQGIFSKIAHGDESRPGLYIAESLDTFLIAIVSFIISTGVVKVFFFSDMNNSNFPKWLQINTFKELKILLWEAILLTLVVFFITLIVAVVDNGQVQWTILAIPIAILLLAISLAVMKGDLNRK